MAKGRKTGGRVKGSINKSTLLTREIFARHPDFDPLEAMIMEYKGSDDPKIRAMMLREIAHYRHSKLNTTMVQGDPDKPLIGNIVVGLTDA